MNWKMIKEEEMAKLRPVKIIYNGEKETVTAYRKYSKEDGKWLYFADKEGTMPLKEGEFEEYIPTPFELFGIECGKGWSKLIEPIFAYIKEYNKDKNKEEQIQILQVKEKFASLRFYTNFGTPELHKMIEDAEDKSYHTCEFCGSTENIGHTMGWITTMCHNCIKKSVIKDDRHKLWIREDNGKAYFVFPDKDDEETNINQF